MRRADARRVAVQKLYILIPLDFQGKSGIHGPLRTYPELFALMGGKVPDLRGLFLRGVGGNSAGLGVKQEDSFKAHSHRTPMAAKDEGGGFYSGGSIFSGYWDTEEVGGIETRPVNQAVRYLVRARP